MGFFDKVKDFAEDASKNVASTSKSLAVKTDTKLKISSLNKEIDESKIAIRKIYEKIGKMFVDEYQGQIRMEDDEIKKALEEINRNNINIEDLKSKIQMEEDLLQEKLQDIEREKQGI